MLNSNIWQAIAAALGGQSQGLLGQQPQNLLGAGQLGAGTQDRMNQYLQSLYMRRYNPPALNGPQNTVRSQMGPGGMQYMAPVPAQANLPSAQQSPATQQPADSGAQAAWSQGLPYYYDYRDIGRY